MFEVVMNGSVVKTVDSHQEREELMAQLRQDNPGAAVFFWKADDYE